MASKAIIKLTQSKTNVGLRFMSQQRKGFLGGLVDNIKEEFNKNKEMKDTIKKFREEAKKLEDSDALKEARKKYKLVEDETDKSSKIIKEKLGEFTEKVKESEFTKKTVETSGKVLKKAQEAAQNLSNTDAMKKVSENVKAIKTEIDEAARLTNAKLYRPPKELRKRTEVDPAEQKVYESNTEAQGVVLHKDSKWFQSWNNFKENNAYVNKLFDLKTKYDESDNSMVRASRALADRLINIFGGTFKTTEMSETLTEIIKLDPNFEINEFLKFVQNDVIPNILESVCRQDLDILRDWCTDTAYTILSHPLTTSKQLHLKYFCQVLDISNLDVAAGRMMEQGPVLIVTFNSHQVIYVTDLNGKVVEGDKTKVKNVMHVWALCRDQTVLDPKSAWRLMECTQNHSDLYI